MQENLVSAAPNVILNLLQIQLCKILDCLRALNDAKPASQAKQGSKHTSKWYHQMCKTTDIHQEFMDDISSVIRSTK